MGFWVAPKMKDKLLNLSYEIELQPGEKLTLPPNLVASVGAGRWVITVRPADLDESPACSHAAFLNGYSEEDEVCTII